MPKLSDVDALKVGEDVVSAVYFGPHLVFTAPVTSKNLLEYDEATFESLTVPASVDDFWSDGLGLSTSAEQADEGTKSLKVVASYSDIYLEFDVGDVTGITPGETYTISASIYSTIDDEEVYISQIYSAANGSGIANATKEGSHFNSVADEWTYVTHTDVAPLSAGRCRIRISHHLPDENDVLYVDKLGLWVGDSVDWEAPLP